MPGGLIARVAALSLLVAGCYSGARANADVNAAWYGRSRAAIEARWGAPTRVTEDGSDTILEWVRTWRSVDLPSAEGELTIGPGHVEVYAAVQPGAVRTGEVITGVRVDGGGRIIGVAGPSLRRGAPNDANLRWGTLFGFHAGMGRLDDTSTPLPSGGLYLGGMLTRTLGLVGTFALVSGKDDAGGAMGMAWGIGTQFWPSTRFWVRGGAAMVLDFDPGFEDATLGPGLTGAASYALVKSGAFVLDLRLDLVVGPAVAFGSVGVGVNLN